MIKDFFKNIFSVTNISNNNIKHKQIIILGFKIKFKLKSEPKNENVIKTVFEDKFYKERVHCLLKNYEKYDYRTDKIKIYLINDTRRLKYHLGCHTVINNIKTLAKMYGMEIIFYDSDYPQNDLSDDSWDVIISKADAIIVNGEGSLHHNRGINIFKKCEIARKQGLPCFLINTVWQQNKNVEKYLEMFDIISVRESISYELLPEKFLNKARIVPDLSLYGCSYEINDKAEDNMIFVDSVFPEKTKKIENLAKKNNAKMYYMSCEYKNPLTENALSLLTPNSLIITGRFHAATLAIKNNLPFRIYASNTHKIEGMLKDAKLDQCILPDNIQNFRPAYSYTEYCQKCRDYCNHANFELEKLFNDISTIITEKINA